jgi:hypothetical protein
MAQHDWSTTIQAATAAKPAEQYRGACFFCVAMKPSSITAKKPKKNFASGSHRGAGIDREHADVVVDGVHLVHAVEALGALVDVLVLVQ